MRYLVFLSLFAASSPALGQQLGQVTITQIGSVKITRYGFNSPIVPPGQFNGGTTGVFNPGTVPNAYFNEPIPSGAGQLGYIEANQSPPIIEIASGQFDANEHLFSATVGSALPFPAADFDVFVNADTGLQGPHKIEEVKAEPDPGSFQRISLTIGAASPGTVGDYFMYVTVAPNFGVLPGFSFLDDVSLVEGPPGQVPEPSSAVVAGVAAVALARRRRARSN